MLKDKIASLVETARKVIRDKKLFLSDDEIYSRVTICDECDNLDYCYGSSQKPFCKKCGCGLYAKVSISGATCPIGKW